MQNSEYVEQILPVPCRRQDAATIMADITTMASKADQSKTLLKLFSTNINMARMELQRDGEWMLVDGQ